MTGEQPPGKPMDFVFMLTRDDRTVSDCLSVLDAIAPLGLRHVGFKDVGVDLATQRALVRRIRELGATSYLEVVSLGADAARASARAALDLGVDQLLGGTDAGAMLDELSGSAIACYPFPGRPEGHPTRLGGTPLRVAEQCRELVARGCAGVDLLAYRAFEAEPLELVRAAREALGEAKLIVAGSVDTREKVHALGAAGADAFTVGSAIFEGRWSPQPDLQAQLRAVLEACQSAPSRGRPQ